ncbi:flagellin [Methanoculleus sp. Afa-1]|uniref:Flagellin n=1 Tax=Methanoculleus formosensis TaxID=2590886 RepID=A0A9E5DDU1_9EURY|nr:archaellin/type IV pilin N-terminal domain-containing protein [Methanoculleus sp. Afa-1]MCT8337888.1 flagellin [Methanoculleus sp. Afa-1]
MSKLMRNEDAFTGLEAAIVLIAFIVVAAVFSYVVLGAGFFTTQKSQEVVHTGVAQASSNMEVSGPVILETNDTAGKVYNVSFYLQLAAGGAPVDMKKVTYTVSTKDNLKTYDYGTADNNVTLTWFNSATPANQLLEKFETVRVDVPVGDYIAISANERFTVEVKPDIGASYPVSRVAPPDLAATKFYEVY